MTALEVRRPKFDFTGDVPWEWNPANPQFSFFMNATSIIAICFEQMIVAAVQEAAPLITDPEAAAEATAFLRQEAQHSSTHRKHVSALIRRYPGLAQTLEAACASFDHVTKTTPLKFRLAYIADLEATFTPSFKMMLDNEETLFRPGDDRVASLLLWHFVEEVEHRSSALVVYNAAIGDSWYRIRALPAVVRHLLSVARIIAEGVNEHVPEEDRKVDARTFLPAFSMRQAVKQRLARRQASTPNAFATVPRRERLVSAGRVLMSQTPFHDPANDRLPEFADRWFARWKAGDDITRWYTSQPVAPGA
ncbi:putative metal-dependent hydrolase [Mycolicibacterium sp. BK556]|uniref:metal-dependent hydrolase n=1 Tax=unclassified Mycolicibacterium TaxID=2636767 RepID=UPI00161327E8|nr:MULTISPECIES: metal-dependent hydrolase [unclassified Mycolicibacterium]MBB3602121.1 putative metal-dependent hydrolase [Mycolicibacterium sp. BK556]MBB3631873.1 putative metal-dependent hydrolase [Mycolicibacterium sp. BK607]